MIMLKSSTDIKCIGRTKRSVGPEVPTVFLRGKKCTRFENLSTTRRTIWFFVNLSGFLFEELKQQRSTLILGMGAHVAVFACVNVLLNQLKIYTCDSPRREHKHLVHFQYREWIPKWQPETWEIVKGHWYWLTNFFKYANTVLIHQYSVRFNCVVSSEIVWTVSIFSYFYTVPN